MDLVSKVQEMKWREAWQFSGSFDTILIGSLVQTVYRTCKKNYVILASHWSIKMYTGLPLVI